MSCIVYSLLCIVQDIKKQSFLHRRKFSKEGEIPMSKKRYVLLPVLLWVAVSWAQVDIAVHQDTLENGLTILVVPDTNVAVVSCRLYYFVGSMYEGPGTSGLSHMYEHMMFKGTKTLGTTSYESEKKYMTAIDSLDAIIQQFKNEGIAESDSSIAALRTQIFSLLEQQRKYIKKDEISEIYQSHGATNFNAWTGDDMTAYIVTLPQNKVEVFYWIESDRMKNIVLREFYSERDVVTEERKMRYENRPVNRYFERLMATFYKAHPYRLPTIGWYEDIRAYTRSKLRGHINKYYTPDNAVIVMVGNIDPEKAVKDIDRYFGDARRAAVPKQEVVTREPAPIGQTRLSVRDVVQPRIDILLHTPGYPDDALFGLDILSDVLNGKSGRLYKRLVNEEKLCISASAGNAFRIQDGYFYISATLKQGTDPLVVEKIIGEELEKLKSEPPTEKEITRIKNTIKKSYLEKIKSLEGLSDQLAFFERLASWKDFLDYPKKVSAVPTSQLPVIARKWLNMETATIGVIAPPIQSSSESTDTVKEKL